MNLATLQQWLPAALLVAAHRLTDPGIVAKVWSLLRRAEKYEPQVESIADHIAHASRAAELAFLDKTFMAGFDPAAFDTPVKYMAAATEPAGGKTLDEIMRKYPNGTRVVPDQPKGEPNMSNFKFALNIGVLASAMAAALPVAQSVKPIFAFGAKMIETVEKSYAAAGAGVNKRAAVLAATEAFAGAFGAAYPTIKADFEPWLETVIGAYNAANAVVNANAEPVDAPAAAPSIAQTAESVVKKTAEIIKAADTLFGIPPAPVAQLNPGVPAPSYAPNTAGV
jgi:hypothetical protein